MIAYLDTHAAVFLWEGRSDVFGVASRAVLATAELRVSPMVRLELQYLRETERIGVAPDEILGGLELDCGVRVSDERLAALVSHAMGLAWTRDPFDRVIVATAALHDAHLVTRDRAMLANYERAVW